MIFNPPEQIYRGKNIVTREWVEGIYIEKTINGTRDYFIIPVNNSDILSINPDTVLQPMIRIDRTTLCLKSYLKDVNKKDIYTGDIIENIDNEFNYYMFEWRTVVFYNEVGKTFYSCNPDVSFEEDEFFFCRVIGNMHDNPELIEHFGEFIKPSELEETFYPIPRRYD